MTLEVAAVTLRQVARLSKLPCIVSKPTLRYFHITRAPAEQFFKANKATFLKAVSAKDRVTLVDFYADWCGPCHQLSPILNQLTNDPAVKPGSGLPLDLVTINTEDEEGLELGQKYKVRALPTVVAFRDGKPIDQFVGALNEKGVRHFLSKV